jgi:uncharacterized DUF497 family protein
LAYTLLVKAYTWDPRKNERLQRERGVSFESVVEAIQTGGFLVNQEHPNAKKYPGQRIFVVNLRGYAYIVPFLETETEVKLITVIPSRKATREYLKPQENP